MGRFRANGQAKEKQSFGYPAGPSLAKVLRGRWARAMAVTEIERYEKELEKQMAQTGKRMIVRHLVFQKEPVIAHRSFHLPSASSLPCEIRRLFHRGEALLKSAVGGRSSSATLLLFFALCAFGLYFLTFQKFKSTFTHIREVSFTCKEGVNVLAIL